MLSAVTLARWRYTVAHCDACKRKTRHTAKGCAVCRARLRKAKRLAKRSVVGSPLQSYSKLRAVADALWSVWVRARWGCCEMCGARPGYEGLQNAHGWSRTRRSMQFEVDNTFSLCQKCHRRHTPAGPQFYEWMRERLFLRDKLTLRGAQLVDMFGPGVVRSRANEAYLRLELMSQTRGGLKSDALHGVIADATARIHALPAGPGREWAEERMRAIVGGGK